MVCNGNSRNCSSEMFNRGMLEWMLCSILGGTLFHRPNPNCFLKVVNNDKFPTSNTLRKIHSFSRKMKSWWSDGQYKWSYSTSMGDNFYSRFTPWCPFEPETSVIDYALHISIISSKSQNHPTWILTTAHLAQTRPDILPIMESWELYYYLRNIHLSILGGASTSCTGKKSYQSCHWDDPWS